MFMRLHCSPLGDLLSIWFCLNQLDLSSGILSLHVAQFTFEKKTKQFT